LLYPEPKFHADRTILRCDILNRANKKSKLNITPNDTLYGEIIKDCTQRFVLKLYRHEASCGLFATAELLVLCDVER